MGFLVSYKSHIKSIMRERESEREKERGQMGQKLYWVNSLHERERERERERDGELHYINITVVITVEECEDNEAAFIGPY